MMYTKRTPSGDLLMWACDWLGTWPDTYCPTAVQYGYDDDEATSWEKAHAAGWRFWYARHLCPMHAWLSVEESVGA